MHEIRNEKFFNEIACPKMTGDRGLFFGWDMDSQSIVPRRLMGQYLTPAEVRTLIKGLVNYLESPLSDEEVVAYKNWELYRGWLLANGHALGDIPLYDPKKWRDPME